MSSPGVFKGKRVWQYVDRMAVSEVEYEVIFAAKNSPPWVDLHMQTFTKPYLPSGISGGIQYDYNRYLQETDLVQEKIVVDILFESFHNYDDVALNTIERAINYIVKPSLRTARSFLHAMKIPIPLEKMHVQITQHTRKTGGNIEEWKNPAIRRNFAISDFVHDIQNLRPDVYTRIMNLSKLSAKEKLLIGSAAVAGKANQDIHKLFFPDVSTRNSIINQNPQTKETVLDMDQQLYQKWLLWTSQKDVHIVIDGVLSIDMKTNNIIELLKSLMMCAFLHVLFANANKIYLATGEQILRKGEKPKHNLIQNIILLDGPFQKMDGFLLRKFYTRWVQKVTVDGNIGNVSIAIVKTVPLQNFYYPNVTIQNQQLHIQNSDLLQSLYGVRDHSIPMQGFPAGVISFVRPLNETPLQKANRIQTILNNLGTAISKEDLKQLMNFVDDFPNELIELLILLNHIRDAAKAETAIYYKASFITCDLLAFSYYHKQCRAFSVQPPRGIFFKVDETKIENTVQYSYTIHS